MAQKPVLRVEVGSRALRVRSVPREEAWASAGVQDARVSGYGCVPKGILCILFNFFVLYYSWPHTHPIRGATLNLFQKTWVLGSGNWVRLRVSEVGEG